MIACPLCGGPVGSVRQVAGISLLDENCGCGRTRIMYEGESGRVWLVEVATGGPMSGFSTDLRTKFVFQVSGQVSGQISGPAYESLGRRAFVRRFVGKMREAAVAAVMES